MTRTAWSIPGVKVQSLRTAPNPKGVLCRTVSRVFPGSFIAVVWLLNCSCAVIFIFRFEKFPSSLLRSDSKFCLVFLHKKPVSRKIWLIIKPSYHRYPHFRTQDVKCSFSNLGFLLNLRCKLILFALQLMQFFVRTLAGRHDVTEQWGRRPVHPQHPCDPELDPGTRAPVVGVGEPAQQVACRHRHERGPGAAEVSREMLWPVFPLRKFYTEQMFAHAIAPPCRHTISEALQGLCNRNAILNLECCKCARMRFDAQMVWWCCAVAHIDGNTGRVFTVSGKTMEKICWFSSLERSGKIFFGSVAMQKNNFPWLVVLACIFIIFYSRLIILLLNVLLPVYDLGMSFGKDKCGKRSWKSMKIYIENCVGNLHWHFCSSPASEILTRSTDFSSFRST